jgi:hypothetical protein
MKGKTQSMFIAIVGFLLGQPSAAAMVYKPTQVPGMGDQWLYFHEGVHYLYHLYEQPAGKLHGVYLATSRDGVHFEAVGPVIEKQKDAVWLGSGSVWRAGGKYIMNFSEARAHQSISFAQSEDLIHWQRLGDEYRSNPDPRWYEVDRWDCIWALPREGGGFWGFLSANPWRRSAQHPDGLTYRSTGMLESSDGVRWTAIAPPVFDWGTIPEMTTVEIGAVRRFKDKYYLLVQTWGPYPGGSYLGATAPGVYTFIGDTPRGPFRPDTGAFRFLGNTNANTRSTHFARFCELPHEVLVNHFLFTRSLKAWLAPLKKAVVDGQGHLRLAYWQGNDAMKGKPVPVAPLSRRTPSESQEAGLLTVDGSGGITVLPLDGQFDVLNGAVLEGTLEIQTAGATPGRCGIYIEETAEQGTAVLVGTDGKSQLGDLKWRGATSFEPDDSVEAGITPRREHAFRLLTRQYMLEFYLDDRLIQCYSLPERATGRIGFVVQGGRLVVDKLKAWAMTFPAVEAAASPAQPQPETPAFPADPPATWLAYHLAHPGTTAPGDPNAAFHWKGRYHLHYIYEGKGDASWAHVSSPDMVHWQWHPTTLTPAAMGHELFSGTGFFTKEGRPAIIYHGSGSGRNQIAFAEDDRLERWSKFAMRPAEDLELRVFFDKSIIEIFANDRLAALARATGTARRTQCINNNRQQGLAWPM